MAAGNRSSSSRSGRLKVSSEIDGLDKEIQILERQLFDLGLAPSPNLMAEVKSTVALEIIREYTDLTVDDIQVRFKRELLKSMQGIVEMAQKARAKADKSKLVKPKLITPG